jgi:hypothetical protein
MPLEDVVARAAAAQRGESKGSQRGVGKVLARQRRTRGMAQSGAEAAGALHMAGKSGSSASGRETEEAGAGGGRRGLVCDFLKVQGSYCNCGRTNLNYTGSSTRVLTEGLPRTSNGIKLLICRVTSR